MSAGVVDPRSVQDQFVLLTRECDKLRRDVDIAEKNRRNEEVSLQNLRSRQATITNEIRAAHAKLGTFTKKKELIENEKMRLDAIFEDDRNQIISLNDTLGRMKMKEERQKKIFIKEMDSLNNDMDRELKRYEEKKIISRHITVESVKLVIDTKIREESERNTDTNEINIWNDFATNVQYSLDTQREENLKFERELKYQKDLKREIETLRSRALKGQGSGDEIRAPIGEIELEELEKLWDESWENDDAMESTEEKKTDEIKKIPTMSSTNGFQGDEPVNMGLFYGNTYEDEASLSKISSKGPSENEYELIGPSIL